MPETARLIAGVPLPLMLIGPDRLVISANTAAQALLGKAYADPIEGRHHGLFLRAPDLLAAIAAALDRGQGATLRLVTPGPSSDRVHEVTLTPLEQGVLLAFEDLTEAEEIDRMRRDFVANVSHELRTPLTAVLGFIETLQGPARRDEAARDRFLAIMAQEAERMNRLVRDLLHLSRVEAEERIRPETRADLAAIARSVIDTLTPMAEGLGVKLVLTGAEIPVEMRADGDQMVQVMTNLVENALKYGSPPGASVTLDLAQAEGPRGRQVRMSVSDQGDGIDPLHIPRLTERFYRVDSHRSREKGGTGLGLAIVKHIVNRHRGRLTIESTPGQGSRFTAILPLD